MNDESHLDYWENPDHNRRRDIPGRRSRDFETCSQHKGTCEDIKELRETMMPKWVLLWIGGPTMAALLTFAGWAALKGVTNSESIIEIRSESRATATNVENLMKHFDLTPVVPQKTK
jgi:hypothetical protein